MAAIYILTKIDCRGHRHGLPQGKWSLEKLKKQGERPQAHLGASLGFSGLQWELGAYVVDFDIFQENLKTSVKILKVEINSKTF